MYSGLGYNWPARGDACPRGVGRVKMAKQGVGEWRKRHKRARGGLPAANAQAGTLTQPSWWYKGQ